MINIINKEEIIEVYQSRICFEQGTTEIISDVSLVLKIIDFLEKDNFIDGLIMDEDKSKINISFHADSLRSNADNFYFYMIFYVDNESKGTIFKIRVETDNIDVFFNEVLKHNYEVLFYYVYKENYSFSRCSYTMKFYKNNFLLSPKIIIFKDKFTKIYGEISKSINLIHFEIKGIKANSVITQELLNSFLLNENYPKLNDEFLTNVLSLNDRDFFINRLIIFSNGKDNSLGLSIDQIIEYYDLMKSFETIYFKEELKLCECIVDNKMMVEFETDFSDIYLELRFDIGITDTIDSIKRKELYIDNKYKFYDFKVKDWIENKEEVKNIIRLLNY